MHSTFATPTDGQHARACRYCHYFGEWVSGGVWCERPEQRHVCACGMGCVFFQREPGSEGDDAPGRSDSPRYVAVDSDRVPVV